MADGKTTEAVTAAQKAVDLQKTAQQYGILAEMYRKGKQYEKALEIIKKGTDMCLQSDPSFELTRAYCLMHLARFPEAMQVFAIAEKILNQSGSKHRYYDSRIKLYCGVVFMHSLLQDNNLQKDSDLQQLMSRSINFIQNVDQYSIGNYQEADFKEALRLIKKMQ